MASGVNDDDDADYDASFRAELLSPAPRAAKLRTFVRAGCLTPPRLRARLWRVLLLGTTEPFQRMDGPARDAWLAAATTDGPWGLGSLSPNEERVLEADVPRTRSGSAALQAPEAQRSVKAVLSR